MLKLLAEAARQNTLSTEEGQDPCKTIPNSTEETQRVDQRFSKLHCLSRSDKLKTIVNSFDTFNNHVRRVNQVKLEERDPTRVQTVYNDAAHFMENFKQQAENQPPPLKNWLLTIADNSIDLFKKKGQEDYGTLLNKLWTGTEIEKFCRKAIEGRYPFNPNSNIEVAISDFGKFFGSGSGIDQFYQEHIKQYVDTAGDSWTWDNNKMEKVVSDAAIQQFQYVHRIKNGFFQSDDKKKPLVEFYIEPKTMDPDQVTLRLDDKTVTFDSSFPKPSPLFKWPGNDFGRVHISFISNDNMGDSSLTEQGGWAWFKMIEGKISPTRDPRVFDLNFRIGGHQATFKLHSNSSSHPFGSETREALRNFRCLSEL